LNQDWADAGNIFSYFSPAPTGLGGPPRTGFWVGRVCHRGVLTPEGSGKEIGIVSAEPDDQVILGLGFVIQVQPAILAIITGWISPISAITMLRARVNAR
jgi:hypothetical protein